MRIARISRNARKKFWGCPNFKVSLLSFIFRLFVIRDCE